MIVELRAALGRGHGASGSEGKFEQGVTMIWETPVAIDLRLGMEITMYAEHR